MSQATTTPHASLTIETFKHPEGCLGFLVVDPASGQALAIDPRLDLVAEFQAALDARGARLVGAIDTHTHADHLSGVRKLAGLGGATVLAHAASKLKSQARRLEDGATIELGMRSVKVIHAPGHTPDSLALLIDDHLFTGDALFVGGAGRTDFMGGSASELYDTLRRFEGLPDGTRVHPGHDYAGQPESTIAREKDSNPLLRERDRAALVARMASQAPPPANMSEILRHNLGDADAATVTARELHEQQKAGSAPLILDVRSLLEYQGEHIEGSRGIPLDQLDSRLGELPEGVDIAVVCRTGVRALSAADVLARAGRRPRVVEGGMNAWKRAALPLKLGRKRLPVDRQVQLIVGLGILAGVSLGYFVHPGFLGLAAFFGAGLTFAGSTGTCGMALILTKLPWNRPSAVETCATSACAAPTKK